MMLYEEGKFKFQLEDPVSKYLPEFKNPKVFVKPAGGRDPYTIPAAREITIKDLLTHTSGLTYDWNETLGEQYKAAHVASGLLPYDGTIADSVQKIRPGTAEVALRHRELSLAQRPRSQTAASDQDARLPDQRLRLLPGHALD